jgi:diadenosine tetraphosphate (Ap4A) HIT family hydrolase
MLHKIDKKLGKKYSFIIKSNWIDDIIYKNIIFENNVYTKFDSNIKMISGELIISTNLSELNDFCKEIISETYKEYLYFISKHDFKNEQWVYNILNGKSEIEKIRYRDEYIVILPNYTWDEIDLSKLYLLTFPIDKKLHSIRDLTGEHISLLEHIKKKTLELIKSIYNFDSNIIKIFFHYAPSTYHLHIHFVLISNIDVNSSIEYSHDLSTVITNLKIKSDYYKIIEMNKRI